MSRAGTIGRRSFLIGSAAVAGGVAVGYYWYNFTPSNPLLRGLGKKRVALTPYVRIDQEGVTIITPRTEVGQGVYSILAALVAEELDLAWEDVRIDPGPPSTAYHNGKVAAEGFPFAAVDRGILAEGARTVGDVAGKFLKLQLTGGSSTTPDGYEKMRRAGAAARAALIASAARKTGIAISELKTRDGAVILPDGRRLPYPSLAKGAAKIGVPSDVTLKPKSEWRYLGKSMPRLDMVAKCTGRAQYGIDLRLPDMVYATVRANPRLGSGVKSFNASVAAKMRGVLKIVPITGGVGVIADNTWRAFKAAETITFEWQPATYPDTTAAMFDRIAATLDHGPREWRLKDDGDVGAALAGGSVVTAEYRVPALAHAPLEPMGALVLLKNDRLFIWASTQIPLQAVASAAEIAGLSERRVRLYNQLAGGSFGRRLEDDFIRQAVELAVAMEGRPVKMTWTREEDMTHDFCRPPGIARMRGAVKDGKVHAFDARIAYPSVTASQFGRLGIPLAGPDIAIVAGAWDQPFSIPNYRVTGYHVPDMPPVSSWRSVGASGNGFFHDCFLDELIHEAGADPMQERIRLAWHEPSRKVLEAVAEMSNWGSPLGEGRGRGVAFTLSFGVPVAEVVEVTSTPDGIKIDQVFAAVDVGTVMDPRNVEAQVSGAIIWGLGHAMNAEITYKDGVPEQTNYHAYEGMRLYQTPRIEVRALENGDEIRGIGEPGTPPAAPALANAIFAATGKRIRELPLNKHIRFV